MNFGSILELMYFCNYEKKNVIFCIVCRIKYIKMFHLVFNLDSELNIVITKI